MGNFSSKVRKNPSYALSPSARCAPLVAMRPELPRPGGMVSQHAYGLSAVRRRVGKPVPAIARIDREAIAGVNTMLPDVPEPNRQTGDQNRVDTSEVSHPPRLISRRRQRPFRLLHLMALVAAVALTLVITPALLKAIMQPLSGWGPSEHRNFRVFRLFSRHAVTVQSIEE
jgi:hypothetical protein